VWLNLGRNSINYIDSSTFENERCLTEIYISGNKITSIEPDTFSVNVELQWLNLNDNNITDIQPSAFQTNSKLTGLQIAGNITASINPGTFDNNRELKWLNLERNIISYMKKEDQQDATIRCLLLTSVSTCFGHHYAHLQENKPS